MPTKIVHQRIVQAKADMMKYRDNFRDAEIRGAIQGDVKDLLALEKLADQVLAAKNGSKKYRLPFSFQKKPIYGEASQKDQD
ncbi:hypothetical protein M3Y98_00019200 [Aphelenchoides besseyi]|nr:hypothetical protein M3Y98_00019200 [Aphelenchoides besseyi]